MKLRDDWNIIVSAATEEANKIDEIIGSTSSTSQSATSKGFQAMSQDTGEELNGRFTALQISNEEIKNSMLSMLTSVNVISTITANSNLLLSDIRNLSLSSNQYLEDIAGYQKNIVGILKSDLRDIK